MGYIKRHEDGIIKCILLLVIVILVSAIIIIGPSPTETITIGDFDGTVINRTQDIGCDNNLRCIKSEVYTGIIVNVEPSVFPHNVYNPIGKIVFEDGYVLTAQDVELFVYKIGSKHIIEVDIWNRGRIVENVHILEK